MRIIHSDPIENLLYALYTRGCLFSPVYSYSYVELASLCIFVPIVPRVQCYYFRVVENRELNFFSHVQIHLRTVF